MSLNVLTESLVKDILGKESKKTQLLAFNKLDELKLKKNNVVVVYPGRFQPFHKGHHDVYRFLKERYTNVFIVTTNTHSKDTKRYPFNFDKCFI